MESIAPVSSEPAEKRRTAERPAEAHFHALEQRIPGFGGYFFDYAGNLVVNLTDLGQAAVSARLLVPVLEGWRQRMPAERRRDLDAGRVITRSANYSFSQLAVWRDLVTEYILTEIPGLVFNDLDETANLVVIGVEANAIAAARAAIPQLLQSLRIPEAAVRIEESTALRLESSLSDHFSPQVGGIRVENSYHPGQGCSIGFLATLEGRRVFITASHCSGLDYALDDGTFHQPSAPNGPFVGTEFRDPGFRSCGFLSRRVCRDSDATAVEYPLLYSPEFTRPGRIARTTTFGGPGRPATGSTTIYSEQPTWQLTGKATGIAVNTLVDKVGQRTGWTFGWVRQTCIDFSEGGNRVLRCQHTADYGSQQGDSGAPVLWIHSFQQSTAQLAGTHQGSTSNSVCADCAVFSPIEGIDQDLGVTQILP